MNPNPIMTNREKQLCKTVLDVLHDSDGGQFEETLLHAEVNLRESCSLTEFNGVVDICDRSAWLTGVKSKFAPAVQGRNQRPRMKWNINDAGEAARREL